MKRPEQWVIPTSALCGGRRRPGGGEQGSIVLEASLVMPLLLIVLVFFIVMIRLCAVQLAVQSAASQTARQIAAHMRPVELSYQQASGMLSSMPVPVQGELADWGSLAAEAAEWLPDPAGSIASAALRGDWQPLANAAATELGRTVVEPLLREYADGAVLDADRLRLAKLTLPDLKDKEEPYITVAAEYEIPFRLPFAGTSITLREQASERVWIGDAVPASGASSSSPENSVPIRIVSLQPSPLRPGQKATVVALTEPNATASLSVRYKSGQSVAKNLGQAEADSSGKISWTWLVGGNTTPGIWELTAESSSGEKVSMHFIVEKDEEPQNQ
ncbi:TadE family protein [Paenibacillus thailandensis]|uniref:TadE family protein n=1 Tax=Paenibacillus thailandensis TaxID=393250 RepID=A0ABW5QWY0_9BACL